MERDINVVVRIKEDGTMSFVSGDGLPLQIGGGEGSTKLYKHEVGLTQGSTLDNWSMICISPVSTAFATMDKLFESIVIHAIDNTDGSKRFINMTSNDGGFMYYSGNNENITFGNFSTITSDTVTEY